MIDAGTPITINSRKYDRSLHKTWSAKLVSDTDEYWLLEGRFEKEVRHPELGIISRGTRSYEYFWKQRWFSVFRFHEPDGRLRNYYCNINLPPQMNGDQIDFIDLDVDILVSPKNEIRVLDLDEFAVNSSRWDYPADLVRKVHATVEELIQVVGRSEFPFSTHSGAFR